MEDKKYLQVNYSNFEKVNEEFLKCTISILSCDQVANGTKFNKKCVDEARGGLNYAPVIGYFKNGDFTDHGISLTIEDDEFKKVVKTVPFGVCIKDSSRWENMQKANGEQEEYLVVDAYLWTRYAEAISKVKNNKCNQSMEISVNNGRYENGYYSIEDFSFSALCIIGEDVEPAFSLAKIRTSKEFSADDLKNEYKEMLDKLAFCLEEPVIEEPVIEPIIEPIIEPVVEEPIEEPVVEPIIEEPVVDYEAKYNETLKELNDLKVLYSDLESLHEENVKELESLRKFKEEIEYKEHVKEVDEALAPYSELEGIEGYEDLTKDKYEADLNELIKNIKIFCFDNNIVLGKKDKKKFTKETKVPLVSGDNKHSVNPDWDFMSKYKKN